MQRYSLSHNFARLELKNGMRADLWVISEKQIAKFIETYKLKPMDRRSLGVPKAMPTEMMIDIDHIIGIRGGRRVPHLHYRGELYFLSSTQWREFSGKIVKNMAKRLTDAKQVNVTELLDVTEAVSAIVR